MVNSPLVWTAEEAQAQQNNWTFQLSSSDIDSIKTALKHVKGVYIRKLRRIVPRLPSSQGESIPLQKLTPHNFRLSEELSTRLEDLADSLYNGIGFGLLQGLDPSEFTAEENVTIYVGITSYLGDQRSYVSPDGTDVLGK